MGALNIGDLNQIKQRPFRTEFKHKTGGAKWEFSIFDCRFWMGGNPKSTIKNRKSVFLIFIH